MNGTPEIDERIEKCEKILAADENSQIFAALAETYRKKGELRKAQDICIKGLKIHPDYASARIVMAKIYLASGQYDKAWNELRIGTESSGRTRAVDILESEILIKKGKKAEARAILNRLYASDPDDETIKSLMVELGEKKGAENVTGAVMPDMTRGKPLKKNISLSDAIQIIKVTPRVLGVVAVNRQGLVMEGRFDGNFSKENIAALSKSILDTAVSGCQKIALGFAREVLIETGMSKLWLVGASDFLLVVLTRDDISMGSLKLKVEDLLQRLGSENLSGEQEAF
jgi:predicted regulator of Ras-like GTPase activity (Roadblock/LC7/MglB family)